MLNLIEKFKVAILHLKSDWNHWHQPTVLVAYDTHYKIIFEHPSHQGQCGLLYHLILTELLLYYYIVECHLPRGSKLRWREDIGVYFFSVLEWLLLCGPIGSLRNRSTCSHITNSLFPPNFCGSMVLKSVFICKTEQWKLEVPGSLSGVLGNKENDQVIFCSK